MDYKLVPHPDGEAPRAAVKVTASVELLSGSTVRFAYKLSGDLENVAVPPRAPAARADRLWEHTCFEAFVAERSGSYHELNFSPSTQWAAYSFAAYRSGMRALELAPPAIVVEHAGGELRVTASADLGALAAAPWPWRVGLAAVIEGRSGRRGYFALRHTRARPDFHDADCFIALLGGSAR
jgi:hypothetical protein